MWATFGQERHLRHLDASLQAGRIAHSYLLAGPPHIGKMTLALDLAAAVNCATLNGHQQSAGMFTDLPPADPETASSSSSGPCGRCEPCRRIRRGVHADLNIVAVGGDPRAPTRISIEQVREAENYLAVTPVEGGRKVVIFDGAETMSAGQSEPANALLKTLEEPPPQTLIILLAVNPDAILPTIRSRCRLLSLPPVPGPALAGYLAAQRQAPPEQAGWLARLARGCPGWAITAMTDPAMLEQRAEELARIAAVSRAPLDERFAYAGALAGSFSGNREQVRQTLYLWQRWWRDLLLLKEGVPDHIHNTDLQTELAAQAETLSTPAIATFLRRLQETLSALDANANPRLTLECLMLDAPPA